MWTLIYAGSLIALGLLFGAWALVEWWLLKQERNARK